ncbi:MAG: PAS domain-containing protein [Paracoccaceae bacterium]|nr:PAS domain-containing protein [Paracoccaceae bacterium]
MSSSPTVDDVIPSFVQIPTEIRKLCDALPVPITFADPNAHDLPLVYVNEAFEKLTQWQSADILGKNCRFLQGPKTDRTIVEDLALSFHNRESDVCSLVNYKRDGTEFVNLIVVEPVHVSKTLELLMGCQFEYQVGSNQKSHAQNAAAIDFALRQLHMGRSLGAKRTTELETYMLDSVLMRFNAVFANVQNQLIATAAAKMQKELTAK